LRRGCARGAVTHEENVSAEQSASEADTRVSCPDGDPRGSQGSQAAAGEGAEAPERIDSAKTAGVSEPRPGAFPKQARLRKRGEYLRVQRDGARQHTEHFVLLKAVSERADSRVGITVSTRVGNAVVRNRVKRVVREILRGAWRDIGPPLDIVVIAKPGAAQTTYAKAATELRRALGIRGT
jgi:ribonuclease P protein component